jgi:hypothetical protein
MLRQVFFKVIGCVTLSAAPPGPWNVATGGARAARPERNPWWRYAGYRGPKGAEETSPVTCPCARLRFLRPFGAASRITENHGLRRLRRLHPWLHSVAPSGASTHSPKVSRTQSHGFHRRLGGNLGDKVEPIPKLVVEGGCNAQHARTSDIFPRNSQIPATRFPAHRRSEGYWDRFSTMAEHRPGFRRPIRGRISALEGKGKS